MGAWQRGRLRLPVKQSPTGHGGSNPSAPTSHAGLAQLAERRPPKPKVRGSIPWSGASPSRRSQVVEGDGLQSRRRKPAPVRSGRLAGQDVARQRAEGRAQRAIGPSSPGLVSSVDQSSRLLPGGSAVRIGHEAPVHFPDSAVGSAPGCYLGGPWFEATSGSQFSLISRSSVAAFALAGAKALASLLTARRGCRLRGLAAPS
jgi:hypothetical protein